MTAFLTAVGLGIAFCALPGAITTQVVRRGLESGFRAALSLQLGALVGVVFWATLALMGAAVLVQNLVARFVLGVVGTLLLGRLMLQAFTVAYRGTRSDAPVSNIKGDFRMGAALSLASPNGIVFWLGFGSSVLPSGGAAATGSAIAIFMGGFLLGAVLWSIFLAALVTAGHRFITPRFFQGVNIVCGVVLGGFVMRLLWTTFVAFVE